MPFVLAEWPLPKRRALVVGVFIGPATNLKSRCKRMTVPTSSWMQAEKAATPPPGVFTFGGHQDPPPLLAIPTKEN